MSSKAKHPILGMAGKEHNHSCTQAVDNQKCRDDFGVPEWMFSGMGHRWGTAKQERALS